MSGTYSSDGTFVENLSDQPSEMSTSLNPLRAEEKSPMNVAGPESNSKTNFVANKVTSYVTVTDDRVNLTFSFPKSYFDLMAIFTRQIEEIRSKKADHENKSYPTSSTSGASEDALNCQEETESTNSKSLKKCFLSERTQKCDINNSEDILTSYAIESISSLCMNPDISEFQNYGGSEQKHFVKADEVRVSSAITVQPVTGIENSKCLDKKIALDETSDEVKENALAATSAEGENVLDETSAEVVENILDATLTKDKENVLDMTCVKEEENSLQVTPVKDEGNALHVTSVKGGENFLDMTSVKQEENVLDATSIEEEENILDSTSVKEEDSVLDATSVEEEENVVDATSVEEENILDATSVEEENILDATSVEEEEHSLDATSAEVEEKALDRRSAEVEEKALDKTSAEVEEKALDAKTVEMGEKLLDATCAVVEENVIDTTSAEGEHNALDATIAEEKENSLNGTSTEVKENTVDETSVKAEENTLYDTFAEVENKTAEKISVAVEEKNNFATCTEDEKIFAARSVEVDENNLDTTEAMEILGTTTAEVEQIKDPMSAEVKENVSDATPPGVESLVEVEIKTLTATSVQVEKAIDQVSTTVGRVLNATSADVGNNLVASTAKLNVPKEITSELKENFPDGTIARFKDNASDTSPKVKENTLDATFADVSKHDTIPYEVSNVPESTSAELEGNTEAEEPSKIEENVLDTTPVEVDRNAKEAAPAKGGSIPDATSAEVEGNTTDAKSSKVGGNVQEPVPIEERSISDSTPSEVEWNVPNSPATLLDGNIPVASSSNMEKSIINVTCTANDENDMEVTSTNVESTIKMEADNLNSVEKYPLRAPTSYEVKESNCEIPPKTDKGRFSQRALSLPGVLATNNIRGAPGVNGNKETSSSNRNSKTGSALNSQQKEKKNEKDSIDVKIDNKNKRMEKRSKIHFDDVDSAPTRARSKIESSLLKVPEDSVVSKFNRSTSTEKTSPAKRSMRCRSLDPSPTKTPSKTSLDKKSTASSKAHSGSVHVSETEKSTRPTPIKKEVKLPVRSSPRKIARAASVPKEMPKREETSVEGSKIRSGQSTSTLRAKRSTKK